MNKNINIDINVNIDINENKNLNITFLPESSLRTLYPSIVKPHFRYCCALWGCCGSSTLLQLQKLQNRATRTLTNSAYDASSSPLIRSLGWMTFADLIYFESKQTLSH